MIFVDGVSDMLNKIYPTTIDVQNNKMTLKILEIVGSVSELECGGHAALTTGVDYFYFSGGKCFLGNIPSSSTASGDATLRTIRINRGKSDI